MDSVKKGKRLLIGIFALILLIRVVDLAVRLSLYERVRDMTLVQNIFTFAPTLIIFFFIYRGNKWARTLFGILLLLDGGVMINSLLSDYLGFNYFNIRHFVLVVMYIIIAHTLLVSKSIKDFMSYQKCEIADKQSVE